MKRGATSGRYVEAQNLFSFPCRPNPSRPKHGRHDEMYRTAAKRMLLLRAPSGVPSNVRLRFPLIRFSTSVNSSQHPQTPNFSDPTLSSSTASSASSAASSSSNGSASSTAEEAPRHRSRRPTVEFEEEQARVLRASLPHVVRLGWTEASMIAGARAVGVSPSIIGSFPRKEAALVEFFMDECLQRLIDRIDAGEDLRTMIPSERVSKLVRFRLEMQSPYISKWPQALSIQAQPMNVPTSFKQRAMLVDEIWHAVGDEASDIDWYVKRTVLGGVYSTTEIYMLTDSSPDFRDTWSFLDNRVKDAFDLKKTIQEATYLAEAVGAGMGSSLQGFVKRVLKDGR